MTRILLLAAALHLAGLIHDGHAQDDAPAAPAPVVGDPARNEFETVTEDKELSGLLDRPIADLELSVRARNCLDSANITTIGELVGLGESEVMNLKNLGKTSMTEIKTKLAGLGLSLGVQATV